MEISEQIQDNIFWDRLVIQCNSIEDYVKILISFSGDNIFNYGRNEIISRYTKSVASRNPSISSYIKFILDLFLFKSKTIISERDRCILS